MKTRSQVSRAAKAAVVVGMVLAVMAMSAGSASAAKKPGTELQARGTIKWFSQIPLAPWYLQSLLAVWRARL